MSFNCAITGMKLICCECPALSHSQCLFKMFFFPSSCKRPFIVPAAVMGSVFTYVQAVIFSSYNQTIQNSNMNLSGPTLKTHNTQNSRVVSLFKLFLESANDYGAVRWRKAASPLLIFRTCV